MIVLLLAGTAAGAMFWSVAGTGHVTGRGGGEGGCQRVV